MYEELQKVYTQLDKSLKCICKLPYYKDDYWEQEKVEIDFFQCLISSILFFLELRSSTNIQKLFVSVIKYTPDITDNLKTENGIKEEILKISESVLEVNKILESIIESEDDYKKSYISIIKPTKTYMNRKVKIEKILISIKNKLIVIQPSIYKLYSMRLTYKDIASNNKPE